MFSRKPGGRRLVSVVAIAAMLVAGAAASGAAQDTKVALTGPTVITRDASELPLLENAERIILRGKPTASGYVYDFVLHKKADEPAKVLRPLAIDPVKGLIWQRPQFSHRTDWW